MGDEWCLPGADLQIQFCSRASDVQSCGGLFSPPHHSLPALGKFANSILSFWIQSCIMKLGMILYSWTPQYSVSLAWQKKAMKRACQHIEWINNLGHFKSVNLLLNKHKNILPSRSGTPVCHHSIRAGPPSWVASANHQFPNLAGTGEKGNLPIWKIYRFLIDSDSRFLLLVTSAPLVTFFNPCCQLFPIVCNQKDNDIIPFLISLNQKKYDVRQRAQPEIQHTMTSGLRQSPTEYWFVN